MAELNEIDGGAIEMNPDIARIQAAQQGVAQQIAQVALPATGFVATINNQSGAVIIQPGTSSSFVTVNVTNGVGTISIGVIVTLQAAATAKSNTAIIAPTITDDSSAGYALFSQWIDTVLDDAYICVDATPGSAIWKKTTP